MVISVGVDAGTKDYEIVLMKKGEFEVYNFKSEKIKNDPSEFLDILLSFEADAIAGLSGYGLPVKRFSELKEKELFFLTLNLDQKTSIGLRSIIKKIKEQNMNFYTIPGVIHLPSVPEWRKFNRLDLGTYDKVCSTVLAVLEFSEEVIPEKQNFLFAEIGYGFTSVIAVRSGKIVDGVGGTSGFMGYSSIGSMDSELAYLLGEFPKALIFSGGVKDFVSEKGGNEMEILSEFVLKGLKSMEISVGKVNLCFLSGRFAKKVEDRVAEFYETRVLRGFCHGKQSAQGAAIIANAIAGGEFKELVKHLEVFNARGSIFDYLSKEIKERILERISRRIGKD
ncbi:MAG: DUF1464 family protein [Archaeoglobaceae archaeon]|nr:DUF1464 family protein [Archaeoglobaceae archaeon]MDW7989155.1 DUF1464 family protein [Archaeoglobaceae archaeon]